MVQFSEFHHWQSTVTKTIIGTETGTPTEYDETKEGDYGPLASLLGGINGLAMGVIKNDWGAIVQAVSTDTNSNILLFDEFDYSL